MTDKTTKLKTINFKGKEYVEVKERVKCFREHYPNGSIVTELIKFENDIAVVQALVYFNQDDTRPSGSGLAYEDRNDKSSFVNKTSHLENCETSAIGRALASIGIGVDVSYASANEVINASNKEPLPPVEVIAQEQGAVAKDKEKSKTMTQDCIEAINHALDSDNPDTVDVAIAIITETRKHAKDLMATDVTKLKNAVKKLEEKIGAKI